MYQSFLVSRVLISGADGLSTQSTVTAAQLVSLAGFSPTQGSIIFAGASGVLSQDNLNFFWDDAINGLGVGTITPDIYSLAAVVTNYHTFKTSVANLNLDFNLVANTKPRLIFGSTTIRKAGISAILGSHLIFETNLTNSGTSLTEVMRLTNGGLLGIGLTPTAFLDIVSGNAARASLGVRTGLAPTSPNDGDIWYDASLKFRSNGVTYDLVGGDSSIAFQCSGALGTTTSQTKFIRTTDGTLSTTTDTIAVGTRRIVSKSSTISKLYVELTTAPGVGGRTVTVYKNGVATALTTGVFTGATANDTVNSFTVVAGDTISCAIINGGVAPVGSAGIVVSVLSIPQ